ncbi:hypothetical protein V6N12_013832 [Hibiscus sabdariffa]|uniref:Uncharacterized protein n=1 Tax=Hibiscus sabdariffa TaxID=183260 RepID=A0ABR2B6W5_9ROSI
MEFVGGLEIWSNLYQDLCGSIRCKENRHETRETEITKAILNNAFIVIQKKEAEAKNVHATSSIAKGKSKAFVGEFYELAHETYQKTGTILEALDHIEVILEE